MNTEKTTDILDLPLVLTVDDLARLFCIGKNSAYELVRSGRIRSIQIGRAYRITRTALSDFLLNSSGS